MEDDSDFTFHRIMDKMNIFMKETTWLCSVVKEDVPKSILGIALETPGPRTPTKFNNRRIQQTPLIFHLGV